MDTIVVFSVVRSDAEETIDH